MRKAEKLGVNLFIAGLLLLIYSGHLSAEQAGLQTYSRITRVTSKVKIDGILDEKTWKNALALKINYEVEPGENIKPPVATDVFLAHDKHHLYIAFRAYDPNPTEIRARYTDRDNIWEDDYVGVILDTFNDSRLTYNFYCNPFGVQAENVTSDADGESQWDSIWSSAGRITSEGYTVEMKIPFSALRFQRKKEDQVWGIDIVRSYPRSLNHILGLFPRDRNNGCYMCQAEKIIGFGQTKTGKNLEIAPTLSGILTQERMDFPQGEFSTKTRKVHPGITAKWRFTPNLTMSGTVNPDFSQVEADDPELDINTQYVLSYPEKRPFFLEDASLFQSYFDIVYTRTIVDPDWGGKITGKEGRHSIGFFSVRDSQTYFVFPWSRGSDSTTLDMQNVSTALRYRLDIGKSSTLGVVVTDREGDDYFNRLAGIDGHLQLTPKDYLNFQWIGSSTHYPYQVAKAYEQDTEKLKGSAIGFTYGHRTQGHGWAFAYKRVTPDFRSDLGTNLQVDYNLYYASLRKSFRRNPGHWYSSIDLVGIYRKEVDTTGYLIYDAAQFNVHYDGPLQSFVYINTNFGKRSYKGQLFNENFIDIDIGFRPSGKLYTELYMRIGDRIDYSNVQAGKRLYINPILEYKLGKRLTLALDHVYARHTVDDGHLYTANLSNLKMTYQFNRRTFLRTVLQYAHYKYSPERYIETVDPEFKHLFSQVIFSYKINPQTVLYLGYSDDYYGDQAMVLKQSNRTFFLKVGYALVL